MDNRFGKEYKLKSKKQIEQLFKDGKWISKFPLKMIILEVESDEMVFFKAGVSVSKRNFKRAVDRNRIKRLMREVIRMNKKIIQENTRRKAIFMLMYTSREILDYATIEKTFKHLFAKQILN
ncbi:MAG: ribonuclease P protein component [Flavobacteriales bacterium]|nr:ribonuclease P protein component [Flavobacteriales bacterium]